MIPENFLFITSGSINKIKANLEINKWSEKLICHRIIEKQIKNKIKRYSNFKNTTN